MEPQIWHLPTGSGVLWGRVQKRNNGLCLPFCLGESCPSALALLSDTSVPPCMPLVFFKLLPQCWSPEGVSLNKSLCGFFKRNWLGLQNFLPLTQFLLFFSVRSCRDLSSWHWNPRLGAPGVGLGPLASEIIPLELLSTTHGCGTNPFHVSTSPPLLPVWVDVVSLILYFLDFHSTQ